MEVSGFRPDADAIGPLKVTSDGSGTLGVALSLDSRPLAGGKNWSFISTGAGASVGAGAFAFYQTGSGYRMTLGTSGGLIVGNHTFATDTSAGNLIMSGNLGIGTTTPANKLSIVSSGDTTASIITSNTSGFTPKLFIGQDNGFGGTIGYESTNDYLRIQGITAADGTLATEGGLFVKSGDVSNAGYVGIGTAAPEGQLHVASTNAALFFVENLASGGEWVRFSSGTVGSSMKFSNTGFFAIGPVATKDNVSVIDDFYMASNGRVGINTDTTNARLSVQSDGTADILNLRETGGTEVFTVLESGNVGIGVASPYNKLHVRDSAVTDSDSHADDLVVVEKNGSANFNFIANSTGNSGFLFSDSTRAQGLFRYNHDGDKFEFRTAGNPISFLIDNNGNVGIGTTTPVAKLSVSGDIYADGNLTVSGITATTSISSPYFTATDANATSTFAGGLNVGSGGLVYDRATGNVGVGVVNPYTRLHLDQTAISGREYLFKGSVSDAGNDAFFIGNGTQTDGRFIPAFIGYTDSDAIQTLFFRGMTSVAQDTGTTPVVQFQAMRTSNATNPNNGTLSDITVRPTFSFLNDNASQLTILANGNVGIGDTTPASLLTVGASDAFQVTSAGRVLANAGASGAGNLAYSFVGDTDTGLYRSAANEMRFQTAGSDHLTIDASGNVGIGTSSPVAKLDVSGGAVDTSIYIHTSGTGYTATDGTNITVDYETSDLYINNRENADMRFWTNGAERMAILSNGNVGIGTTLPDTPLHIYKDLTGYSNLLTVEDPSDPGAGATRLQVQNAASSFILQAYGSSAPGALASAASIYAPTGSKLLLGAASGKAVQLFSNDSYSAPQFTLTSGGRVGIGESSPGSPLAVSGSATIGAGYDTTAAPTNGLLVEGNVGIGTANPGYKLEVGGDFAMSTTSSAQNVGQSLNFITNSVSVRASISGYRDTSGSGGNLRLSTMDSGVTLQERLRIDSAGNVGIGTIEPETSLHVRHGGASGATYTNNVGMLVENNGSLNTFKAFQVSTAGAQSAFTVTNAGNVGIGIAAPKTKLTINQASSATQTDFTQNVASAGLLIETNYTAGNYTPGIFWSTSNNQPTKPKAGIYLQEMGNGSLMHFGTSNGYSTGITNSAIVINQSGDVLVNEDLVIGTTAPKTKLTVSQASSATQTDFTQNVANAGLLIETNYVANNYTPGIFWSEGGSKPKAGVYLQDTGSGSIMHFGTSNSYGTGITNSAIVINQNGNVGIGDTSPAAMLTVGASDAFQVTSAGRVLANAGASGAGNLAYSFVGDTDTGLYRSATDEIRFQTNGADRLTLTSGGSLGIGTTSPTHALGVLNQTNGNLLVLERDTANAHDGRLEIISSGGFYGIRNAFTGDRDLGFRAATSGDYQMVLLSDGNVGIGTVAPGRLLHVNGSTADTTRIRISETGDTSDSHISGLEYYDGATQKWRFGKTGSSHDFRIITGSNYQALSILQSNGAIGLGTTTPEQTLTVVGDGSFNNTHGDISGVAYGVQSLMEYTPTSSGTGIAVGATGKVSYTGSSIDISGAGHIVGSMGWAVADSAGQTAALIIGSEGKLDIAAGTVTNAVSTESQLASNTGTITNWFGNHAHVASNAGTIDLALATALKISNNSSTITTAAGVTVLNPESNTGTISNLIGLFYPDITSSGVTNKYLILNQDDDAFLSHAGGSSLMGAVAIGAVSGNAKLDVQGSGTSTATFGLAVRNSAGAYAFAVRDDGNVGVNTVTPAQKFVVNGTVGFSALTATTGAGSLCLTSGGEVVYNAASNSCLPSMRETKDDIEPLTLSGLDTISALESVSFSYINSDGRTRYGFIAEDVASVDAFLATYDAEGMLSGIDDTSILAVIVKSVQEVWETIQGFSVLFTTEKVQTDELCVGDICVTESELEQLLNQSNIASPAGDTAAEDEPEPDADGEAPEQIGGDTPEPVEGDAVDPTDETPADGDEGGVDGEEGVEEAGDAPQENGAEGETDESEETTSDDVDSAETDSDDAGSDAPEPADDAATQDDAGQGEG